MDGEAATIYRLAGANAGGLAAALLCPRPSFLRVVERVGYDVPAIAECFRVTETLAHLRYGEVTGQPVVASPAIRSQLAP